MGGKPRPGAGTSRVRQGVVALVIAVLGAGGSHFAMRAADVSAAGAKTLLVHLSHPPEYIRKAHVWMPIPPGTAAAEVSQRDA